MYGVTGMLLAEILRPGPSSFPVYDTESSAGLGGMVCGAPTYDLIRQLSYIEFVNHSEEPFICLDSHATVGTQLVSHTSNLAGSEFFHAADRCRY